MCAWSWEPRRQAPRKSRSTWTKTFVWTFAKRFALVLWSCACFSDLLKTCSIAEPIASRCVPLTAVLAQSGTTKRWVWFHRQLLAEVAYAAEFFMPWGTFADNPLDGAGVFSGSRWPHVLAEHVAMGDGATGEARHSFPAVHARSFTSTIRGRMPGFKNISFKLSQARIMLEYRFLSKKHFTGVRDLVVAVDGSRVSGKERLLMFFAGKDAGGRWNGCWAPPLDTCGESRYYVKISQSFNVSCVTSRAGENFSEQSPRGWENDISTPIIPF